MLIITLVVAPIVMLFKLISMINNVAECVKLFFWVLTSEFRPFESFRSRLKAYFYIPWLMRLFLLKDLAEDNNELTMFPAEADINNNNYIPDEKIPDEFILSESPKEVILLARETGMRGGLRRSARRNNAN